MVRPTINQLGWDDQLDQVFPFGEKPSSCGQGQQHFYPVAFGEASKHPSSFLGLWLQDIVKLQAALAT